jgi:hypothetical protein
MALAVISGVIGAIGGALNIAKAFSKQSATSIQQTGSGTGFWRFYSNSVVGTRAVGAEKCGEYIDRMIRNVMKEATPSIQTHTNEVIQDLKDIQYFESYVYGDCDNMINVVDYNKDSGLLYMYVYTFSPYIHQTRGEAVKIQNLKIRCNIQLAKDWMVVSKVKASFFKTKMSSEIQYIPNKGIQMQHVIEAIAIAMAPAVLGLVKLPERFMTMLDTMLRDQMANPDRGVVTAPTSEQTAAAYDKFKEMQAKQDEYIKNAQTGFSQLGSAITGLGQKGSETPAPQ